MCVLVKKQIPKLKKKITIFFSDKHTHIKENESQQIKNKKTN